MIKIICDIDDVLNDLIPKTVALYNKQSGKSLSLDDITAYNFYDCLSEEDADGLMALFHQKALWDALRPLNGAKEGVQKLLDAGHKVYFATATASENFDWKVQWLRKWFPFINIDNVIRIMDKSLIRADIIIDDCMDQLTNSMCERICLSHPWNYDTKKDSIYDIYRCNNWNEIVNVVKKLDKEINTIYEK